MRLRDHPKGTAYLDEAFARYKAAGGTAASPREAMRATDPCPVRK